MYELIAEQPLLVSCLVGVLAAGLIYGWLQTGKKPAAVAGLVLLLLIPLLWYMASVIETDREQLERLIFEIAAAVESNDHETAIAVIADPDLRNRAKNELSRWTFSMARVNRIRRITIIEDTFPLEADVEMTARVNVSSRSGAMQNVRVPRRLDLRFQKNGDNWQVTDYTHSSPLGDSTTRP